VSEIGRKFEKKLSDRATQGLERRLPVVCEDSDTINLADNDYLGLAHHPDVKEAAKQAIDEFGCSASASPLITGFGKAHFALQERLLDWYDADSVMIWNSGFAANQALFSLVPDRGDRIFADRQIHHSVVSGLLRSKADFRRFPHLNHARLEELLRQRQNSQGTDFVVTESVFSMDGDSPDLMSIADLKDRYGFTWIVDEAHALGWYGERGAGLLEQKGVLKRVDAIVGTLGKALGSQGAFIIFKNDAWRRYLMNFSGPFIYSTFLAPASAAAAVKAIEITSQLSKERVVWRNESSHFRKGLRKAGWKVPSGDSPIVPLVLGHARQAIAMSDRLKTGGVHAGMIREPTVPVGSSRLRFSLKTGFDYTSLLERIISLMGEPES